MGEWKEGRGNDIVFQVAHPLSRFFFGVELCLKGCWASLTSRKVRDEHRKCFTILLAIIVCMYIVGFLFYLPIYVTLYLLSFFIEAEKWIGDGTLRYQATMIFSALSFYIPLVTVFVTQYLIPNFSEDLFFATFSTLQPVRSEKLRTFPLVSFWSALWLRVKRFLRLSVFSALTYCLSYLPFLGWMVFPLAQFFMVAKVFGYKTSAAFSLFLLYPPLQAYSFSLLSILFGARALAIETLDPYFSRYGYDKIKIVEKTHQPELIGFAVPFLFLLSIPIAGPLFWGLVQASAGLLAAQVTQESKDVVN